MRSIEIMVAGGGASGMMAAITAAEAGAKVLLVEKMDKLGKKLLATGNGRCNFTNRKQSPAYYHSRTEGVAWQVISAFDEAQVIAWFRERGILPMERDSYVYPRSGQALSVVQVLERMLRIKGVEVHTGESIQEIRTGRERKLSLSAGDRDGLHGGDRQSGRRRPGYEVITSEGRYLAGQLILAVGGAASPAHGTCGDGYALMEKMGIRVIPPLPALTSLVLEGKYCKIWSGVRIHGQVKLYSGEELLGSDEGEIQMTAYGISGIPVFQLSHLAARALAAGEKPCLVLDSMMEYTVDELVQELLRRQSAYRGAGLSAADILEGMLPGKLVSALIKEVAAMERIPADAPMDSPVGTSVRRPGRKRLSGSTPADEVSRKQWECLTLQIKEKRLWIRSVSAFEKAQVTSGGVALSQIDPKTMEVKEYPGLYITGELADVDGICGGYNLQWAWSSGYLAGKACTSDRLQE